MNHWEVTFLIAHRKKLPKRSGTSGYDACNMKRENFDTLIIVVLILCFTVSALAISTRLRRLEKDVEDLRLRVIYGVKP